MASDPRSMRITVRLSASLIERIDLAGVKLAQEDPSLSAELFDWDGMPQTSTIARHLLEKAVKTND